MHILKCFLSLCITQVVFYLALKKPRMLGETSNFLLICLFACFILFCVAFPFASFLLKTAKLDCFNSQRNFLIKIC